MSNATRLLTQRMSLRTPQRESLELLERIARTLDLKAEDGVEHQLGRIKDAAFLPKFSEFERNFPSFAFRIATGVGKTRLMGAFVTYLFMEHGIRDFLILAPNLTIYNKLIDDFRNPQSPKYVFRGIGEFVHHQPRIITGDDYGNVNTPRKQMFAPGGAQQPLFADDLAVNIFNISKLDKDESKIKGTNEYLGEPYFDYLKNLKNLVVIMDESHRYRALRGMQVINELNPRLGLELTATPAVSKGGKTVPFKNIAYEYPLANAIRDGYVKAPYVATRKNLDLNALKKMDDVELDRMKLEDAVVVHEKTKLDLEIYARETGAPPVKPFILVVTKETSHAEEVLSYIKSPRFRDGRYADKVITVHSNLKGGEREETIQDLLSLERPDNRVEIVVHVNMLKEGWDVKNLYTIVPLRAFAADILTEQTLGRGLRLPYGEKTGKIEIDRLTVIAHERFNEIIEAANRPDSIVMKTYFIDADGDGPSGEKEIVEVASRLEAGLEEAKNLIETAPTPEARAEASLTYALKKTIIEKVSSGDALAGVSSLGEIASPPVREKLKAAVVASLPPADRAGAAQRLADGALLEETLEEILTNTIEIPDVTQDSAESFEAGFRPFTLETASFPEWRPVSEQILMKALQSGDQNTIDLMAAKGRSRDADVEAVVRELSKHDEIDYQEQSGLLYGLAGTAVDFIGRGRADDERSNIVQYHAKDIADRIWGQMESRFYVNAPAGGPSTVRPFQKIEKHNLTKIKSEDLAEFRTTYKTTAEIRSKIFKGFKKSCHSCYKFDVRPEKDFAVLLEDDPAVEKWMRPAPNQFKIFYNLRSSNYEPDFVVQTERDIFLVEIKDAAELDSDEVKDKAKSALEYCERVNAFIREHGGRPWTYLLIPAAEVAMNRDFGFFRRFSARGTAP